MDLAQLIENYTPSAATIELVRQVRLALLVGITGAGKDTIKQALLTKTDFRKMVSYTTRAPRMNNGVEEVNGVDYHFIDQTQAMAMIEACEFVEVKFVHGTVYGTSAEQLRQAYDEHKIAIADVDVQGVGEYKTLSPDVIAMFIVPPDYETWRQRLALRYESPAAFDAEWPKRRDSAIAELQQALQVPYYHFIVNDQLERAVEAADEIAHRPDTFLRKDDEARLVARDLLAAIQMAR